MEERRISEKESLTIITEMIQATKRRATPADFNLMLMWGWLSVAVAIAIYVLVLTTNSNAWQWLWFVIPLVGWSATAYFSRKEQTGQKAVTYVAKAVGELWSVAGISFGVLMAVCAVAHFMGFNVWQMMLIMTLPIVGIGSIATGAMLRMKSFLWGGAAAVVIGGVMVVSLLSNGVLPLHNLLLFAAGFFCAFIIPGSFIKR